MSFHDLEAGQPPSSVRKMQDPSQALAAGVFQINTALSTFQRLVNTLGTPKDTLDLRDRLHKTRLHIGQLVKDTSEKLKEASEIDFHTEINVSKKVADAKLAKDFHSVLEEFQKVQRLAAQRETAYAPFIPKESLSYDDNKDIMEINSTNVHENQTALLLGSRRQGVAVVENEIVFNGAITEEREQGIQEIQSQIGEANEIFNDLAVLVHDQGTFIGDITSDAERSLASAKQGTSQLVKASKSQKSTSSLVCLLLVIFGIILLIVIIVVVV